MYSSGISQHIRDNKSHKCDVVAQTLDDIYAQLAHEPVIIVPDELSEERRIYPETRELPMQLISYDAIATTTLEFEAKNGYKCFVTLKASIKNHDAVIEELSAMMYDNEDTEVCLCVKKEIELKDNINKHLEVVK